MIDYNVGVIVPAAGKSERFGGECQKQYFSVMGRPLFTYCVDGFKGIECVKKVCVVSDKVEYVKEVYEGSAKIVVVSGGNSRHVSIKNGLDVLGNIGGFRVVVVHDGARPVVPRDFLINLITEADQHGAAGSTRPLTSTVIRPGDDNHVDSCLDRGKYVASETPQAFRFDVLFEAYQKASNDDLEVGTECLALVLKYCGVRAKLIPGPSSLWKVTEKKDCYAISAYLKELSTRVCILAGEETEIASELENALKCKVAEVSVCSSNCTAIVAFHQRGIISQGTPADIPDDFQGLCINVVMENETFRNFGEKPPKKGSIQINISCKSNKRRLIQLIINLILSDKELFSGQIFHL